MLHGYMQTKNSIMRKEIKQKRIDDNLQAYEDASEYFEKNNNEEICQKVRRRYLENCIELSGKVYKEQSNYKQEKLTIIENIFKKYYDMYINRINENIKDDREVEIVKLIQKAYNDNSKNYINSIYWDELEKIINKD